MNQPSTYRRTAAAAGLAASAVLSTISVDLQPVLHGDGAERLAALGNAGTSAAISAVSFVLAQLPFIAGVLGIGHLLRRRAPRLSAAGTTLGVLGAFGHAVFGGVMILEVTMAADPSRRAAYAALVDKLSASPVMLFSVLGLAGTVLGLLLLAAGLWRTRTAARWIPAALVAFLVVEFVGSAVSDAASYLSSVLLVAAFVGAAVAILRSPAESWSLPPDDEPPTERQAGGSPSVRQPV